MRWLLLPALAIALTAMTLFRAEMSWQEAGQVRSVKLGEIGQAFAKAPASYPKELQGVIWMDQYAMQLPTLALSFGDTSFSTLDPVTRSIRVSLTGATCQWQNNPEAYMRVRGMHFLGAHLLFQFKEDYSGAQIFPALNLGMFGTWHLPRLFLSFAMVKQSPSPDSCPPKEGAGKSDISKCATWGRTISIPIWGEYHDYVYEIVDADGQIVEPHFSRYVEWGKGAISNKEQASEWGIQGVDANTESFIVGAAAGMSKQGRSEL